MLIYSSDFSKIDLVARFWNNGNLKATVNAKLKTGWTGNGLWFLWTGLYQLKALMIIKVHVAPCPGA